METEYDYCDDKQKKLCANFCSGSRKEHIVLAIVLIVLAFAVGYITGYLITRNKTILCDSSGEGQHTNSTFPRSSVTTTTQTPPLRICPPTLPQTTTSNILLSLDETIALTTFNKYTTEYTSSANVATATLMFEFKTVWGSWYLDDVSIKEIGDNKNEIIVNGGFETGNLGIKWNSCDPRYPWILDGSIVNHTFHSGSYSYESKDPGVGSQEYLTQIFNIKSSTKYIVEFYIFYSGEPSSVDVTIISY